MGEIMKVTEQMKGEPISMALIEHQDLQQFWPGVSGMLDKIPHTWGHFTKEEIEFALFNGTLQLWGVGPKPAAIFMLMTALTYYPSKRALAITWGAGTFRKSMLPVLDATLTNYAKIHECAHIEVHGRKGWARMLKDIGFREDKVVLIRPIKYERLH